MPFSLSKLFGQKSNPTESNSLDSIEAIIATVENKPFGVSDKNVLFAGLNELGGYYFFQTVIVGEFKVKTKNGGSILFKGDNLDLQLNADMSEFESDHSDVNGRYITKIDFEIEESDIEKLQESMLKSISLKVKNQTIVFTKYISTDEEE